MTHLETASPDIDRAVSLLLAGELVAFPTETVYGLGADAANPAAVSKIFAAKGRPADHPVIAHLAKGSDMTQWAMNIPPIAWALADAFWPGPLTLILKKQDWVSSVVTGGQTTIGLRVPAHPLAQSLLHAFAKVSPTAGIAAPSANRFGRVSPTLAAHVREELGAQVALVLDGGACAVGIESTILDLSRLEEIGAVVLRPGGIMPAELEKVLGSPPNLRTGTHKTEPLTPRVSGSLDSHYAPTTPLVLCPAEELLLRLAAAKDKRLGVISCQTEPAETSPHLWRCLTDSPDAYARALYATLRELDSCGLAQIVVEIPPATPAWQAVLDRLSRAARPADGSCWR